MFQDGGSQRNSRIAWYDTKKGRGNSPKNRFKLFYEQQALREQKKEFLAMLNMSKATISLMYGQVAVEIELTSEDNESLTTGEIKSHVDFLIEQGFTPRSFGSRSIDNIGTKGTVVGVAPVPNTKMFEVTAKLDNDTEFKWKEFNATTFRIHDRIEVGKNDRGFKCGLLITDPGEQTQIPF